MTSNQASRSNPTALVIIDAQVNMLGPRNPVSDAEGLLARLLALIERSRTAQAPVIFIRNCGEPGDPDVRGTAGWELHPALRPVDGELLLDKTTTDAFESTTLEAELKRLGATRLIVAGLQSDHCVKKTTLGALARGYEVTLVADGHSTYDSDGRSAPEISSSINAEFAHQAKVLSADQLRFS
jgi:nicotinamidase-related amidase